MAFTDEQKLIVTLLTEIHSKLAITDGLDPHFVQKMVSSDNAWALHWRYNEICTNEQTPHKVQRVADVLDMWQVLERTLAGFGPAERAKAEELSRPIQLSQAKFQGYSGNDEDEFSIVHILVEDLGRWSSFKGRNFNSHVPMVDVYDRMLSVYQRVNPVANSQPALTVENFSAVLKEVLHPERRA